MAVTPQTVRSIGQLIAKGLALVDIAADLEIEVDSVREWSIVFDFPGGLLDVEVRSDDGDVDVRVGDAATFDDPEPTPDPIAVALDRARWKIRRSVRRGELDDLLVGLRTAEQAGKARRSVLGAIRAREAVLAGVDTAGTARAWVRYAPDTDTDTASRTPGDDASPRTSDDWRSLRTRELRPRIRAGDFDDLLDDIEAGDPRKSVRNAAARRRRQMAG